jgi:Uma2 family endonuclease
MSLQTESTSSKTLTYEEWLTLPEVEGVEEVVNGEIRHMPPNKRPHAYTFGLVIRKEPLNTRVPDIAVFIRSSVVERDGYIHSPPELVVEVLSPNTRSERAEKLQDYESLGVPEVWVVSPEAQTVEVLRLNENGRLATTLLLREGQLKPTRFPEVSVDIAALWHK